MTRPINAKRRPVFDALAVSYTGRVCVLLTVGCRLWAVDYTGVQQLPSNYVL